MEDKQPTNGGAREDVIDVEEFAKAGKPVPLGRRYRIRIDKQHFTVEVAEMTGRQILALVGKKLPREFILSEKATRRKRQSDCAGRDRLFHEARSRAFHDHAARHDRGVSRAETVRSAGNRRGVP